MGKVRIVIVEDEFIVAKDIAGQLEHIGYEVAAVFDSGDATISFIKENQVDILLIDINIKGALDGIETAEIIAKIADIPFIYVTAYSDSKTLNRAKLTNPHAFIVKPFNIENLHSAIELALFNYSNNDRAELNNPDIPKIPSNNGFIGKEAFFLKMGGRYEKVSPSEVLVFKANGSYTDIVLSSKRFRVSQNLRTILTRMKNYPFVRIHRSHAVNIKQIQSIEEEKVTLTNGMRLSLSKSHREDLMKRVEAF